jgi:hypothetical protein
MGRIRGCNMAVVCAKIKVISGVLQESGGKNGHNGDALHVHCAPVVDEGRFSRCLSSDLPYGTS